MSRIKKLERHLADLIAAGEVVERSASVVKELIENALDADAHSVTVEIKRGGLELIRVSDDGCGIAPDDVPTAFLRHATSKISGAGDLEAIKTMGFRGEALASVAAVSRVHMLTRERGALSGVSYKIEGGDEVESVEAGCPEGTTIIARELFYNTPARMKFIKRDVTEAAQVLATVRRAALASPAVAFKLIKDGEQVFSTPGSGELRDAVYAALGGSVAAGMAEGRGERDGVEAYGYVSKPHDAQGNRSKQEFFVNGRPVRSRLLSAALEEAYKNRLMVGRYPACVLHVDLPPQTVDVNVHPAKWEVKFAYEKPVFDAVYLAVKSATNDGETARASVSATRAVRFDEAPAAEQVTIPKHVDFYKTMTASEYRAKAAPPPAAVEVNQPVTAVYRADVTPPPAIASWRIAGEVFATYIVVEDGDDVLFIDKHAAHERIIFERLKAQDLKPLSQVLLTPVVFEPEHGEREALMDNREVLEELGFDIDDFGGGSVIIRAAPGEISRDDAAAALGEIAEAFYEHRREGLIDKRARALNLVACKAALKAGSVTTFAERYALVERVLGSDDIRYCPHGRPVVTVLSRGDLERGSGRRQ